MQLTRSHKTLIALSIMIVMILGLVSWSIQKNIRVSVEVEVGRALMAVLDTSHEAVKFWMKDHENTVQIWANAPDVRHLTQQLLQKPHNKNTIENSSIQHKLRDYLQPLLVGKGYKGFFIIGPDATNLASSLESAIGAENLLIRENNLFQRVLSGKTAFGLPEKTSVPLPDAHGENKQPLSTMFVAGPVRNASDEVIAVFALHIDPADEFTAILQQGRIGNSGETYAFDSHAHLISNSRFVHELQTAGLLADNTDAMLNIEIRDPGKKLERKKKSEAVDRPLTRMAASAIAGNSGLDVNGYRDYRGVEVVGAWRWDKNLGLGIATELDKREAYQSVQNSQTIIITLSILSGVLLIGLMLFLVVYRQRTMIERELTESEKRYRQVFNSILDVYAEIGLDGTILEISPSVNSQTSYTREELLGRFMGDFYAHPGDREKLLARLYQDGMINDYETLLVDKDGRERPFSFTGRIITDEAGQPVKLAGVMRDISERKHAEEILKKSAKELEARVQERTAELKVTNVALTHEIKERKHAEKALRENEHFVQTVLNTLPDSIAVIDSAGYILSVNKAWESFAEENNNNNLINSSIGTNYIEICRSATGPNSDEASLVLKGMKELLNSERDSFTIEYPCHSPNRKRWFVMHAVPFFEDEIRIVITHTNITERKMAEEALRAERDRAQKYLDTVEAMIISLDENGCISLINRKGCQILGYTEQELLGKNWFTTCLPQPQGLEEVYPVFKKIMSGDIFTTEYYENPVVTRDGNERIIAWHNSYFRDTDGNIIGTLGAGEDITGRLEAEERDRQRQAELAHLSRVNIVGEMAAGIAHELNQPLSSIVTYAEVALRIINSDISQTDKLIEALEGSRNQANRAAGIIRHLRKLVSKKTSQKSQTDVNLLIQDSVKFIGAEIRKQNIKVDLNLENNLPLASVDGVQIEQVLLNLINNSIEAMHQTPITNRILKIQTKFERNDSIQIAVTDTGHGLDEETRHKIFEPFVSTKGEMGMGMGLSISRSIIEAHHGKLTVQSNPGAGATFSFTLPLNQ
ncbi:PAS domain S-box protein [Kaarinaea lacus]